MRANYTAGGRSFSVCTHCCWHDALVCVQAPAFTPPPQPTPEAEGLDWELTSLVRDTMGSIRMEGPDANGSAPQDPHLMTVSDSLSSLAMVQDGGNSSKDVPPAVGLGEGSGVQGKGETGGTAGRVQGQGQDELESHDIVYVRTGDGGQSTSDSES